MILQDTLRKHVHAIYRDFVSNCCKTIEVVKNKNFQWKILDICLIFAQSIDCRYTLEPPRRLPFYTDLPFYTYVVALDVFP